MWDCIDQIRNEIEGIYNEVLEYKNPIKKVLKKDRHAKSNRQFMRRLRAKRRMAGLNAVGKPIGENKKFNNKKYL